MSFYHALLGRALAGGGGSEPVLISKTITSNGTYDASDDNADGYKDVSVSVPNTYTEADEDKVVHNGELVAQTSDTVTVNGTVDTTLISSLLVNVSGGASFSKLTPSESIADKISACDAYIVHDNTSPYVYIYGTITPNEASVDFYLDVPSDFPSNIIGSVAGSAYGKFGSTSTSDYYYMNNLSFNNNKIRLGPIGTRNKTTPFLGIFNLAT